MVKRICSVALLVSFGLCISSLAAAPRPGSIKGLVKDTAGNPILNLSIVVVNTATSTQSTATTDQTGAFLIKGLAPGAYSVQVQNMGTTPQPTTVESGSTTSVSLQASVMVVRVTAETIAADTSTAAIQNTWTTPQIEWMTQPNELQRGGEYFGAYNLPLLSESVTQGNILQNGVGPSVVGRPNTSNNYHIQGTDNNNQLTPGPLVSISNEATSEFSLFQAQPTPQFGHSTGGQMNLFVRDGSNEWHGGIYEYLNNRKLNADDSGITSSGDLRYDQNRMGGKVGGPLVRDHLLSFFNFEYVPLRADHSSFGHVLAPTSAGMATLSATPEVSQTNLNAIRNNVQVSDTPVATTVVAGIPIPLGLVNTVARRNQDLFHGLADFGWMMSSESRLNFRFALNDAGTDNFGPSLPAFSTHGHTRKLLGAIGYSMAVSPFVTVTADAGYNRLDQGVGSLLFPNINVFETGMVLGSNTPIGRTKANTYQLKTGVNWKTGGNDLSFGIDARVLRSVFRSLDNSMGVFGYGALQQYLLDLPPDLVAQQSFGNTDFNGDRTLLHAYIMDKVRVMDADVEFGLGYEFASLPRSFREEFNDPENDLLNLAPRFGIAWSPSATSQTVLRGSFAILYDALYGNSSLIAPGSLTVTTTGSSLLPVPGFLANGGLSNPLTTPVGGTTFVANQKLPYTMNWSGSVGHGFTEDLAMEIKYVGNRGVHLPSIGNFAVPGFANPDMLLAANGTSWYNAGVFKLTERLSAGTQVTGIYTYSDVRNDSNGTLTDLTFGRTMQQAFGNQRHRAFVSALVDIPSIFNNTTGRVRNVLANFTITGTALFATGAYVPVFTGFIPVTVGTTYLGQTRTINLAVAKGFTTPDEVKIEVRGEAYNLANHPQFTGMPPSVLGTGEGFGIIPAFVGTPRAFLSSNPRTIQLALRVIF